MEDARCLFQREELYRIFVGFYCSRLLQLRCFFPRAECGLQEIAVVGVVDDAWQALDYSGCRVEGSVKV